VTRGAGIIDFTDGRTVSHGDQAISVENSNDLRSPPDIVLVIRGELQRREMTDIAILADSI
jgi:hypothetical protein